jgi:hypothetical protein
MQSGYCCGASSWRPIYINAELTGCYHPRIPGRLSAINAGTTTFSCFSTTTSLLGGPKTLTTTDYGATTLSTLNPMATRPVFVEADLTPRYTMMGCIDTTPAALFSSGVSLASFAGTSLEWCAKRCGVDLGTTYTYFGMYGGT